MAVIKIVPMPGAVGDKGDEGAPGPQGQQGPAGQNGLPGTPALWSYQGAYNPAAAYAVGDVVIYQGQLYYTKSVTTAGTLPTNTTKFDLIASKGADGANGTNGADGATPFTLIGAYDNGAAYNLGIAVYYNGGTYVRTGNPLNPGYPPEVGAINASWTPLAEKGEDWAYSTSSGMWDTNIKAQSNISGGHSIGLNSPSMGTYTKMANVVNFVFTYNLSDEYMGQVYPLSFDNSGGSTFSFKLPFPIEQSIHGGVATNGYNYAMNHYVFLGRFFGRVDSSLPVGEFNQPDEEGWTEVHGIGFTDETDPNNRQSYVILTSQDFEDINTNSKRWRNMSHSWPFDFSGTNGHRYFQLQISGTYISS